MANTFINKKADLTATSATTLYTVPSATTSVIKSILVSEDSGNADTITVTITDTSDAVFSLFKTKSNSANGTKGYSRFYKNGSGLSLAVEVSALGGSNPYLSEFTMNNTTIVDLAQNDYIEFFGRFDTGSGTISFDKSESYFAGFRIK